MSKQDVQDLHILEIFILNFTSENFTSKNFLYLKKNGQKTLLLEALLFQS